MKLRNVTSKLIEYKFYFKELLKFNPLIKKEVPLRQILA